jgi:hypothetical protein
VDLIFTAVYQGLFPVEETDGQHGRMQRWIMNLCGVSEGKDGLE